MNDAVDVVRIALVAPPIGIADHDPATARLERFEHERAGAVSVARRIGLLAGHEALRLPISPSVLARVDEVIE
jgi:hypothetical protein